MKVQFCHFILFSIVVYLTAFSFAVASLPPSTRDGTPFCGVSNWQPDSRRYARTLANLKVGEPRTVRLIYFLPNDRPFRAEVAQRMKDEIRNLQTFFAKQMGAHGYGRRTFSLETDARGEPMVHRVNGQHPNSYYITAINVGSVFAEVESAFDANSNVYLIVLDNSTADLGEGIAGLGTRYSKNGGDALVTDEFEWWVAAHELGHAFGLEHDFRDGAYIMSYGPGVERLSKCSAEFLTAHTYFNPNAPIAEAPPPTIELISPLRYPAGSKSISLQFKIGDSDGVHQALLFVETVQPHSSAGFLEVKAYRGLARKQEEVVVFNYGGVIPSDGLTNLSNPTAHPITVGAVDVGGNFHTENFILAETSRDYIASLEGHTDRVNSVSFSHDGKTLASEAADGAVRLWDVEMETSIIVPVPEALSVSLSPNGRTLASGSWDGRVTLWHVATRQNIATLEAHIDPVSSVSFAPDGKTLASGAAHGPVKLWSVATRQNIATFRGHTNWVSSVSFSPDGKTLASGAEDGAVKLWNVATRQNIATLEADINAVSSVSFAPDGRTLASGSRDGRVKLWNVATRQNIATLEAHIDAVSSVLFAPDGKTLASGAEDGTVKLWDVETELNFTTLAHVSPVTAISSSRDGSLLASGTAAGTVELWDTSRWMQSRLDAATEVKIPDPNLRAAISTALGLPPSAPILAAHMETLKELEALEASISDLTGLEWALNLRWLFFESNSISNVFPLAGLTNLKVLDLAFNSISDLSPVSGLLNLMDLNLPGNHIADISAISGLTNLRVLNLAFNSISDLAPLAVNIGLGDGDLVGVRGNPLNYLSIQAHISSLQERGVSVDFDIRTPASLVKIAGDQHGPPATPLPNPFVVEVRDGDGLRLEGVSVAFGITAGGGTLSTTSTTTDADGRARSVLTLGPNSGITIVSVAVGGIETPVTFTAVARDGVVIPDSNLRAAVGNMLGKAPGAPLVPAEIATLTEFYAAEATIGDLTGLEFAINLIWLYLNDNSISDLSPVSGLTNLTTLYLYNNDISNISSISGLTKLTELVLAENDISDLSPLVSNLGLGEGDFVSVEVNPLSYASIHVSIPTLQGREVEVIFSDRTPTTLLKNSGDNQTGAPGEALADSFVVEVRDGNDLAFEGVPVTYTVTQGGGTLSVRSTKADANGRAESTLTLGPNPETNTVEVTATGIQVKQTFNAEGIRIPKTFEVISGNDQQGSPGAALEMPFVVEVRDQADNPLPEVQVTFSVSSGGGTLSATSVMTDAIGRAESILTLGPNPGTNTVVVTVTGVQGEQTFTAEGIRIPKSLEIISGDKQQGLPGTALEKAFVVEVRDQLDTPLPGAQVTFSVTSGGGTLSAITVLTDSNGRVESRLMLGPNPGTNTVTVSVTGIQEEPTFNAEGIQIPKAFWIISGFDQKGLAGEALANPFIIEVRDQSGQPLPDVQVIFSVTAGGGTLSVTTAATDSNGWAQSILTLGPNPGTNTVTVSVTGIQEDQSINVTAEPPPIPEDVNGDDVVNILDLVLVAAHLGDEGAELASDVNGDGAVNILDLVLVAGALGNAAAPPSRPGALTMLTAAKVEQWLAQAQTLDLTDATAQMGVMVLEQLVAALTPEETLLLPNYPNPFNPETWIPYQLSRDAEVALTIYDAKGFTVRRLELGHQLVGYYSDRGKAVHWDGRNDLGESVASGVYFYHLSAGRFSAARKMLIIK